MIACQFCGKRFAVITHTHLGREHRTSVAAYNRSFKTKITGFGVNVGTLPESDPRYRRWRLSLRRRPPPWNTRYTKETHPGVAKISETFRQKRIDNFAVWRKKAKARGWFFRLGRRRAVYAIKRLSKNGDLAEFIGVMLGDGNITKFPRTEGMTISANSNNPGFINRYARLTRRIFRKQPTVSRVTGKNCVRIRLYQTDISGRLGVPAGNRRDLTIGIPRWIWGNKRHVIRLLRGLFEAEGSLSIHPPTYTHNLQFSNRNISLLQIVGRGLRLLGYHPEFRSTSTRLRKKREVEKFLKQVRFRRY